MKLDFKAPRQDFGEVEADGQAESKKDGQLWKFQQERLRELRMALPKQAELYKAGKLAGHELASMLGQVAGKVHTGDWGSMLASWKALDGLGKAKGFVVLGGWYHAGDVKTLAKPDKGVLDGVKAFKATMMAEAIRRKASVPDTVLAKKLLESQKRLAGEVETGLLFMRDRVFIFTSWGEFIEFVKTYDVIKKRFKNDFGDSYLWGWYPKRRNASGVKLVAS